MYASENGNLELVKYLIKHGANVHAHREAPLRMAASNGHLKVVEYLLDNGANPSAQNNAAIKYAEDNGYEDVADYIKDWMSQNSTYSDEGSSVEGALENSEL